MLKMTILLGVGLLALNFGISWFNAWSVGRSWNEAKAAGGWVRFMAWMGATMSACGFTYVYLALLAFGAGAFGYLPPEYVDGALSLGYLVIIGPVLGSGIAITVQSWARAWRERNLTSGAIAGWNTFAQIYNTAQAVSAIPDALSSVLDVFGGKRSRSKDSAAAMLAVLIVIVAVAGGILTTSAIIRSTARSAAEDVMGRFGYNRRPAWQRA